MLFWQLLTFSTLHKYRPTFVSCSGALVLVFLEYCVLLLFAAVDWNWASCSEFQWFGTSHSLSLKCECKNCGDINYDTNERIHICEVSPDSFCLSAAVCNVRGCKAVFLGTAPTFSDGTESVICFSLGLRKQAKGITLKCKTDFSLLL